MKKLLCALMGLFIGIAAFAQEFYYPYGLKGDSTTLDVREIKEPDIVGKGSWTLPNNRTYTVQYSSLYLYTYNSMNTSGYNIVFFDKKISSFTIKFYLNSAESRYRFYNLFNQILNKDFPKVQIKKYQYPFFTSEQTFTNGNYQMKATQENTTVTLVFINQEFEQQRIKYAAEWEKYTDEQKDSAWIDYYNDVNY